MAVRCSKCKSEYDVTLFEFGNVLLCSCGGMVSMQHKDMTGMSDGQSEENERISEIKKFADRISFLIVSTDYPMIDLEIEKEKFREKIRTLFPDKAHLYSLIYEPRFKRLEEQFRVK